MGFGSESGDMGWGLGLRVVTWDGVGSESGDMFH